MEYIIGSVTEGRARAADIYKLNLKQVNNVYALGLCGRREYESGFSWRLDMNSDIIYILAFSGTNCDWHYIKGILLAARDFLY